VHYYFNSVCITLMALPNMPLWLCLVSPGIAINVKFTYFSTFVDIN